MVCHNHPSRDTIITIMSCTVILTAWHAAQHTYCIRSSLLHYRQAMHIILQLELSSGVLLQLMATCQQMCSLLDSLSSPRPNLPCEWTQMLSAKHSLPYSCPPNLLCKMVARSGLQQLLLFHSSQQTAVSTVSLVCDLHKIIGQKTETTRCVIQNMFGGFVTPVPICMSVECVCFCLWGPHLGLALPFVLCEVLRRK